MTETLWLYRFRGSREWFKMYCGENARPCTIEIDIEEEYETTTTRTIPVQHTLFFVWKPNYCDSSKGEWKQVWLPVGRIPNVGPDETYHKTTTEELR
jgi:hypothetical protein